MNNDQDSAAVWKRFNIVLKCMKRGKKATANGICIFSCSYWSFEKTLSSVLLNYALKYLCNFVNVYLPDVFT